jgi:membrane protease YdiL (CAAX protease family)
MIEEKTKIGMSSRRHFAMVVLLLVTVGTATLIIHLTSDHGHSEFQSGQRLPIYFRVVVLEWLLFAYVASGIRREGRTVGSVIVSRTGEAPGWVSCVASGVGAAIVWMAIGAAMMTVLRPAIEELHFIQSFLPHASKERVGFSVMTLTAGFCEEFIYRGYLQEQFLRLTRSMTLAIVLQAALFAILHVTLPWKFAVSAAGMALFLGALVAWKKTLFPAMLAHTLVNLLGGLLSSGGSSG